MMESQKLVDQLSTGLQPVRPVRHIDGRACLWLLISAGFVIGITHWFGPIRPSAINQLETEPRFLVETLLGVLAIITTTLVAFRAAIPGALPRRLSTLAGVLMVVWLGNYLLGLLDPALEPSMVGKRDHCFVETLIYALPPMLLAFAFSRRLYPLRPVYAVGAFGLVAGMLPALYMQIACMYVPLHILQMHILPGLLVMLAGVLSMLIWHAFRRSGKMTAND